MGRLSAADAAARAALWPLIAQPDRAPVPADAAALGRAVAALARLAGPALADAVLRPAAARTGMIMPDPAAVARSRLAGKFALAQQRRWVAALADGGIDAVCLKGFANAHALYPDPSVRIVGDLDLLVRAGELPRAIRLFADGGFRFRATVAPRLRRVADASFMPLVSADGACDIDLHVQPDSYPAWRSLSAELLFAAAERRRADGLEFRVPSAEHGFLLGVTNAAKDKFDLFALRRAIDALLLLRRADPLDWDAIQRLARAGRFHKPLRSFCALLVRLGLPAARLPVALRAPPGGLAGRAFARMVADFQSLFPAELPLTELLWREFALAAEFDVALHHLARRLRGLVRPHSGLPPGISPHTGLPEPR